MLSTIDIVIILLYLLSTVVIGLLLRKKAKSSKDDYLLGGKKIPWYMLGLSNASGMFDISGTMWLVTLTFVYGLKSIWIPWLWPVFNQIFLMVYLSAWLRRSNVTTGAEWIFFRFGDRRGGKWSHTVVVIFAIVSCLGFLAYGFIGLGKFVEIFLPWETISPYMPFTIASDYVPHFYGIVFTCFAVFYTIMGGMSGIVWADLLQYTIMTISSIAIAIIAWQAMGAHDLLVPEGWLDPFFGWNLDIDWTGLIDEVNAKIASDGFSLFGIFFMLMVFKGILISIAGPAPNYDMQKILSTKNPAEAAKMSGFVSFALIPIRYLMIAGFAVLGILFYNQLNLESPTGIDFERILPSAISQFVPVGLMGLLLAGLLAAFMSTFAGTLNAAQAYLVNDIFLKQYPKSSKSQVTWMNYGSGILVVVVSVFLGFYVKDVNSVLQWIVSALWGGYAVSNILKWHWWRFNGSGYFWGMLSGIIPAIIFPVIFEQTLELYLFPLLLLITALGSIIGTYAAPPTEEKVLIDFYKKTRPWGFWKPIYEKIVADEPDFKKNTFFKKDMGNVLVGTVAQTVLVAVPIYLVLREYTAMWVSIGIICVCGFLLKKFWWNTLETKF